MLDLFYQYLIRYNKIVLPGLGTVVLQRKPSTSDIAAHTISPPVYAFVWQPESAAPSHRFFLWLAHRLNVAEEEAAIQVNNFIADAKREINAGREIKWKGVGIIRRGFDSGIEFEPENKNFPFEEFVPAEKVIHEHSSHTILVGDTERKSDQVNDVLLMPARKKLITPFRTAVAILIIALLFIAWILRNGMTPGAVSNKSKLDSKEAAPSYKEVR